MTLPLAPAPVLTLLTPSRRRRSTNDDAPPQSHRSGAPCGAPAEYSWLFALRRDPEMRPTAVAWVARPE